MVLVFKLLPIDYKFSCTHYPFALLLLTHLEEKLNCVTCIFTPYPIKQREHNGNYCNCWVFAKVLASVLFILTPHRDWRGV